MLFFFFWKVNGIVLSEIFQNSAILETESVHTSFDLHSTSIGSDFDSANLVDFSYDDSSIVNDA
jgi:hypothetical protein